MRLTVGSPLIEYQPWGSRLAEAMAPNRNKLAGRSAGAHAAGSGPVERRLGISGQQFTVPEKSDNKYVRSNRDATTGISPDGSKNCEGGFTLDG